MRKVRENAGALADAAMRYGADYTRLAIVLGCAAALILAG